MYLDEDHEGRERPQPKRRATLNHEPLVVQDIEDIEDMFNKKEETV